MSAEFMAVPQPGDRCANVSCVNRMGEGAWILVNLPALTVSPSAVLKAVHLSMCAPCATRLSHETTSEREGV